VVDAQVDRWQQATRNSITEICLDCGVTNLTHFNRVFRRWTNKSPRQYRNESPAHAGGVCTEWIPG